MTCEEFEKQLKAENFDEIISVEQPIGYAMGEHQHPFDACALITKGDLTLVVGGVSTTYGVGDIFRLPAQTPHHENAVPHGVTYVAGRKYPVAA